MNNVSTKDFCRTFGACHEGTRFALKFDTMRECYAALLRGEAGENSTGWAIWVATCEGVMSDCALRLFAVRCARRVQHLVKDERSIKALDVAERYANGVATDEELIAAQDAAWSAARDAAWAAAWAAKGSASRDAAQAAADAAAGEAADAAWYVARDAEGAASRANEWREQLKILAEFGNPFEENEK